MLEYGLDTVQEKESTLFGYLRQTDIMETFRSRTAEACVLIPPISTPRFPTLFITRRFLDVEAIKRCAGYSVRTFLLFHGNCKSDGHIRWMGWVSSCDGAANSALRSSSFGGYIHVNNNL